MVNLIKKRKGQAAIEFLMTYGWMMLVVLIVGALIFSFINFNGLLPNKVDLSNGLIGQSMSSMAYSNSYAIKDLRNVVIIAFKYAGTDTTQITISNSHIQTELNDVCNATFVKNAATNQNSSKTGVVGFIGGQIGIMYFNCSDVNGNTGLVKGSTLKGIITIYRKDPTTGLDLPSSGSVRLSISQ